MSCLNYHLITGLGQIAGDDVPSWLLDYRFRLMFPQIKNPPETLWNQTAVCQYLLSQDSWVSKVPGRKNVNRAFDTFWFYKKRESGAVTLNFPPSEKHSSWMKISKSHPLSVSLREPLTPSDTTTAYNNHYITIILYSFMFTWWIPLTFDLFIHFWCGPLEQPITQKVCPWWTLWRNLGHCRF